MTSGTNALFMGYVGPPVTVSINQSKFIFQAMRKNYNIINVTALERLPEKH